MLTGATVLWALLCAVLDLARRRLPNPLILGGLLIAVAGVFVIDDANWADLALGLLLAAGLTLPGFIWGRLGAGDVKFLLTVAALQGVAGVLTAFIVGSLLAMPYLALTWLRGGNTSKLPLGGLMALGLITYLLVGG